MGVTRDPLHVLWVKTITSPFWVDYSVERSRYQIPRGTNLTSPNDREYTMLDCTLLSCHLIHGSSMYIQHSVAHIPTWIQIQSGLGPNTYWYLYLNTAFCCIFGCICIWNFYICCICIWWSLYLYLMNYIQMHSNTGKYSLISDIHVDRWKQKWITTDLNWGIYCMQLRITNLYHYHIYNVVLQIFKFNVMSINLDDGVYMYLQFCLYLRATYLYLTLSSNTVFLI